MDPEAAVDILKEETLAAERLLDAKWYGDPREALDLVRDHLDEAGEAQDNLAHWLARGGFRPRRYDTWLDRYVKAEKAWSAAMKRMR